MNNLNKKIITLLFTGTTLLSWTHAYAVNTGEGAEDCIKTWRVYDKELKYEKFKFDNRCGKDAFVFYCGALKFSDKKCNAGTVPGFYTHSTNVPAGEVREASIIFNGQLRWGACIGRAFFGHEAFTDTPDGGYTCINMQKGTETPAAAKNPAEKARTEKAAGAKSAKEKKAARAREAKEAAQKARTEKAAAAKSAKEEKAARARAAQKTAETKRVTAGNNSDRANYLCLPSQSLGTCASYYQCTPANNSITDLYYHTSNGGDFHGDFKDPASVEAAARNALKSCGI